MWLNSNNSSSPEGEKQLQEELKFLNDQVFELNQKLKEAENYKSQFLSNIRNEILDPFSSIVTLSRAILELENKDVERIKKLMALIYQDSFLLDLHLKNIFYAAEIESGALQPAFARVDSASLLAEINSSLKPFLLKKKIRLLHPLKLEDTFHSDGEKIQLIILNLIYTLLQECQSGNSIFLNIYLQDQCLYISIFNLSHFLHKQLPETVIFKDFHASLRSIKGIHHSVAESLVEILNGSLEVGIKEESQIGFKIKIPTAADEGEDLFSDQGIFFG
jgi:K+-sensing histidine kinase KdpD